MYRPEISRQERNGHRLFLSDIGVIINGLPGFTVIS
jgi:hypothetical protein